MIKRLGVVVLVMVMAVAACGDDSSEEPIEFGEGEVPSSMPDEVPIPPGGVVGSTLIDRVNNRTEMGVRARLDYLDLVQFYELELVSAGFIIDESAGSETIWTIRFSDGDLLGDVKVSPVGQGFSQAVVSVNRS